MKRKFYPNDRLDWKVWSCAGLTFIAVFVLLYVGLATFVLSLDHQVFNGYVTNKKQTTVSCEHSYQCRCRTVKSCSGSGENKSCHTSEECDTCYEHPYDYDWDVMTTVGDIEIRRVDRQGSMMPPRWKLVEIGDPASIEHMYLNYLKNTDSLFSYNQELFADQLKQIPDYPRVFDYYRYNRIINQSGVDISGWNSFLNEKLKTLGVEKQVNIVLYLTKQSMDFSDAVLYKWKGGKKNDIILFYGIGTDNSVEWFRGYTIGDGIGNQELLVGLRNQSVGSVMSLDVLKKNVELIEQKFKRVEMKQFKYLSDQKNIPIWFVLLCVLLSGVITASGVLVYQRNFK